MRLQQDTKDMLVWVDIDAEFELSNSSGSAKLVT